MTDLSVVVPVHNEEENIAPLFTEIVHTLDARFDYEVIYIDDGSTDSTLDRLLALKRNQSHLRVVTHTPRSGQSTALYTGAKLARASWIATLDGDGQNDPADIPRLLTKRDELRKPRLGLLAGWRRERQDNWRRRISGQVANSVRARMLRDGTPDTGCGLKLFRREAFMALPYFDHMHRFLPALMLRAGWKVISVEVTHRPRIRGTSKYGVHNRLWVGIVDLLGVAWLQRRARLPYINEVN
jgi:dolichol-phosphate mannosyltransferase